VVVLKIFEKTCMVCKEKMLLDEHPLGLVFKDEHFICEKCSDTHSKQELSNLNKTIMQSPQNGMPIALWLIHEQNKNKSMMTGKNKFQ
jgi:hypothetical protein